MKIGVCRHCFAEGPKRRGERRTHQTYPLRVEAASNPSPLPPIRQPRACNFPPHGAVSRTETSASRPGETGRPPLTRPCPATNPPSLRTWEPVLSHANKAREDAEKAAHKARVIASVKCCVCEHAYTEEAYEERLSRCAVRGCPGAYMSEDVELLEFKDWFA